MGGTARGLTLTRTRTLNPNPNPNPYPNPDPNPDPDPNPNPDPHPNPDQVAERVAGEFDQAAVDARLDADIASAPVVLFSFTSCPFCKLAKATPTPTPTPKP